ncbi:MAG: hypothetical protein LDL26_10850 [Caenispirillum bisanense]|nr:hypothetical protein [Caenispirillum bisanense]MCA1974428.1 hypothetical protein [Caenispirillum sp.]
MNYQAQWKAAKDKFTKATGKKKPSEKVGGLFRKSSGIEDATKGLEQALAKPDAEKIAKAEQTFAKARDAYVKTLEKAAAAEKADDYKKEVAALAKALDDILEDYMKDKKEVLAEAPRPLSDILGPKLFGALTTDNMSKMRGLKAFCTDKRFAVSGADGSPLPQAAAMQKQGLDCASAYVRAVKAAKAAKSTSYKPTAGYKAAAGLCSDIGVTLAPMEGMLNALANWKDAQEKSFATAGKAGEFGAWMKSGPLSDVLKAAGSEANDELTRINNLEAELNRYF